MLVYARQRWPHGVVVQALSPFGEHMTRNRVNDDARIQSCGHCLRNCTTYCRNTEVIDEQGSVVIGQLVAMGGYYLPGDGVNDDRFPGQVMPTHLRGARVDLCPPSTATKRVLEILKERKRRPATVAELLMYVVRGPGIQLGMRIVALAEPFPSSPISGNETVEVFLNGDRRRCVQTTRAYTTWNDSSGVFEPAVYHQDGFLTFPL